MKWTQSEAVQSPYQPLRNALFYRLWSACVLTELNRYRRFFEKKKVPEPKHPSNGSFVPQLGQSSLDFAAPTTNGRFSIAAYVKSGLIMSSYVPSSLDLPCRCAVTELVLLFEVGVWPPHDGVSIIAFPRM